MSEIRIGLLGFGTVGSAVHALLGEGAEAIERVTGGPVVGGRILGGSSVAEPLSTASNGHQWEPLTCDNDICAGQTRIHE